ncbi:MAG: glycine cleavage system protein H [Candidatus Limnocylindria bacterium]
MTEPFVHRGCELPAELLYAVDKDVWVRLEVDGVATLGMMDTAQTQCGKLVHIRFKPVGRTLRRHQSAATIESAKWVGPFPTPLSGEIVATNEETFARDILAANKDPYGRGWLVRVRPSNLEQERAGLAGGETARGTFAARIDELGISCMRCAEADLA